MKYRHLCLTLAVMLVTTAAQAAFNLDIAGPGGTTRIVTPVTVVNVPIAITGGTGGSDLDSANLGIRITKVGQTNPGGIATFNGYSMAGSIWPTASVGFSNSGGATAPPANLGPGIGSNLSFSGAISNSGNAVSATGTIASLNFNLASGLVGDIYDIEFFQAPSTVYGIGGSTDLGFTNLANGRIQIAAVPEPSAFALVGLIGVGAAGNWYRKKRKGVSEETAA